MKDHIEVNIGNDTKAIKMSYGLLNECSKIIGDIDGIADIALNSDVRDRLLVEVLSDRNEMGKIVDPILIFNLEMEAEDVLTLLDWVGSHVADFFLSSMTRTKDLMVAREDKILALMPTSNGGKP